MSVGDTVTPHAAHLLYSDHHDWLFGWLRRRLGCNDDAADIAHDTFVRVLLKPELETLRQPRAFLATIANGLVINQWRRRDIERALLDVLAQQPLLVASSPERREILLQALIAVDAMLTRLPAKVRSAFLLAQLEGLRYGEIARRLGVSERMVKKYMAQAMLHCLTLQQELDLTDAIGIGHA